MHLFLLIELKPTSIGDGEPAAPRTLPYLEINVGQKRRCKKALVCLKGWLLLPVIVVDLIKDITSTSELYNAKKSAAVSEEISVYQPLTACVRSLM